MFCLLLVLIVACYGYPSQINEAGPSKPIPVPKKIEPVAYARILHLNTFRSFNDQSYFNENLLSSAISKSLPSINLTTLLFTAVLKNNDTVLEHLLSSPALESKYKHQALELGLRYYLSNKWLKLKDPVDLDSGRDWDSIANARGIIITSTLHVPENLRYDEFEFHLKRHLKNAYLGKNQRGDIVSGQRNQVRLATLQKLIQFGAKLTWNSVKMLALDDGIKTPELLLNDNGMIQVKTYAVQIFSLIANSVRRNDLYKFIVKNRHFSGSFAKFLSMIM